CRFGCRCLETPHHLFVECRLFDATSVLLREAKTSLPTTELYLRSTRHLFIDDAVWPVHASQYYLGTVPAINPLCQVSTALGTKIAHTWHIASICLAAQIWGNYRQIMNPSVGKAQCSFELPTHLQHLHPRS
ncbi:hypothetical protein F4604DRAFT_1569635, partial [Suillus subluteus]